MDKRLVNYKLLERRKINDYLDSILHKSLTAKETQKVIHHLSTMGPQVVWVCLNRLERANEMESEVLSFAIEVLAEENMIPKVTDHLVTLISKASLPLRNKGILVNLLQNFGVSLEDLPEDLLIDDLEEVAINSIEQMLNDIYKNPEVTSLILRELDKLNEDMFRDFIEGLTESKHNSAAYILKYLALSGRPQILDLALNLLVDMNTPYAYKVLQDLLTEELANPFKVTRALSKMKDIGSEKNSFRPQTLDFGPVETVYLSNVDGTGNRILWFLWSIPDRKTLFRSINLLINCEEGVKDCWGSVRITKKELENLKADFEKESIFLKVNEEYATAILKDALAKNKVTKKPIPLEASFWINVLPKEAKIDEVYRFFNLNQDTGKTRVNKEDMITLLDHKGFEDWYISNDQVMALAHLFLKAEKKGRRINQLKEIVTRFSKEILNPLLDIYYQRLLYQGDLFLESKKEEDKELGRKIMALIQSYPKKNPEENPFFNRLIFESLTSATALILSGRD